jgi:hypothetical protein
VSALAAVAPRESAGRICPADYRYPPSVFDRTPELAAEVLYVVGGLYGNLEALKKVEWLACRERTPVTIVFNGDFHWFDAEPDWFAAIEKGAAHHHAIRGNVETEIARADDIGAGCGCAYPADVDDGIVMRSNEMLRDLRSVAHSREALAALPMHLVARVSDLRIGIVHGDAASLAGWRFAHDALDGANNARWLNEVRRASSIDLFASTHTCLAALRDFALPDGRLTVINNGAAGVANFCHSHAGLITRIATTPSPHPPLYGMGRDGVFVDALPLDFDLGAFMKRFLARWPEGSAAHASYFRRITSGPDHSLARAFR